jgi:hypothetical protein
MLDPKQSNTLYLGLIIHVNFSLLSYVSGKTRTGFLQDTRKLSRNNFRLLQFLSTSLCLDDLTFEDF